MNIGEKLSDLRTMKNKTLKDTSNIVGVSLNTVYRWEHNRAVPRKASLRKLAAFFNVPYEWFTNPEIKDNNGAAAEWHAPDNSEGHLLKMYRDLPNNSKYKVLGYVERVYVEDQSRTAQAM